MYRGLQLDMANENGLAPEVHILFDGYSVMKEDQKTMKANCTCSVIKGPPHIIVDTMTAWDKDIILQGLASLDLKPDDISFAVATHGHADHVGNLNLFTAATHVVGACVSRGDVFFVHNFDAEPYRLSEFVDVFATPGHTADDVSVRVRSRSQGTVIIAGDLFEREDDLRDAALWRGAGSQDPDRQVANRVRVLAQADRVVPGHGPMFVVTERHRQMAANQ